jgi:hypothetical protein
VLAGALVLIVGLMANGQAVADPPGPITPPPSGEAAVFEVHGRIDVPSGPTSGPRCPTTAGPVSTGWVIEGVTPGRVFLLTADAGTWRDDFEITFYGSRAACDSRAAGVPFANHAGDERSVVPAGAAVALVTLATGTPGAAFAYRELAADPFPAPPTGPRKPTVVAVVETITTDRSVLGTGFSPYHYDFLGSQHPWNLPADPDPANDIDFAADPAAYIAGYPTSTPINLTLPQNPGDDVSTRATVEDAEAWRTMEATADAAQPKLYRFPGTKVVGAIRFGPNGGPGSGDIHGTNDSHGTHAAASAAGNIHGTCPECVLVLVGITKVSEALRAMEWARHQEWIDVVTNSWEAGTSAVADGIDFYQFDKETGPAVESGQTWVMGAGNGIGNLIATGVPQPTYYSSGKGPDWVVTVGAVGAANDQSFWGSSRPADIVSYGEAYPSSGTNTANGSGAFGGSSNATPVVAGTIAKVIQWGREILGDTTQRHAGGVLAVGAPRPCDAGVADCPLADGTLTRAEAQAVVYDNVLPSPTRPWTSMVPSVAVPNLPNVSGSGVAPTALNPSIGGLFMNPSVFSYTAQGHGIVYGRKDPGRHVAEQRRFRNALIGTVEPYQRPPGEQTWMIVDSKCRQRLWGAWPPGAYTGIEPVFDPTTDQPAMAVDAWCSSMEQDSFADFDAP